MRIRVGTSGSEEVGGVKVGFDGYKRVLYKIVTVAKMVKGGGIRRDRTGRAQ